MEDFQRADKFGWDALHTPGAHPLYFCRSGARLNLCRNIWRMTVCAPRRHILSLTGAWREGAELPEFPRTIFVEMQTFKLKNGLNFRGLRGLWKSKKKMLLQKVCKSLNFIQKSGNPTSSIVGAAGGGGGR